MSFPVDMEVEELCSQLNLAELEKEEFQVAASPLEEVISKGQNCLLTKFHTNRPYNREAFKTTMRKIWRPAKPIKFHEVGVGIMMVEFKEKADKDRILKEIPWNFDKCLLLLQDFEGR